jgi:hypothetical protein
MINKRLYPVPEESPNQDEDRLQISDRKAGIFSVQQIDTFAPSM